MLDDAGGGRGGGVPLFACLMKCQRNNVNFTEAETVTKNVVILRRLGNRGWTKSLLSLNSLH